MSDILGYLNRGMNWLSDTFSEMNGSPTLAKQADLAKSRSDEGEQALKQKDYATARRRFEESLAIYRQINYTAGIALMYWELARVTHEQYDYRTARTHAEKSVALFRIASDSIPGVLVMRYYSLMLLASIVHSQGEEAYALQLYDECLSHAQREGKKEWIVGALHDRAVASMSLGDYDSARRGFEESLALFQELNLKDNIAINLSNLGCLVTPNSDYTSQRACLQEALRLNREQGAKEHNAYVVCNLGTIARYEGDYDTALTMYRLSLTLHREFGHKPVFAYLLENCAKVAVAKQQGVRAARLFGAAAALREALGVPISTNGLEEYEENILAACSLAGEEAFMTACAVGRAMPMELAIEYALHDEKD